MPGFDGTGPMGYGPGTGRAMGYCGVVRSRPYGFRRRNYGRGGGVGGGVGYGRGFGPGINRWWGGEPEPYYGPGGTDAGDEKAYLKEQANMLKAELTELEKRMAELEQSAE